MRYFLISNQNELSHHGILGMKWGIRRYQNKDGSLTEEGKKRYEHSNLVKDEALKPFRDYLKNAPTDKRDHKEEVRLAIQSVDNREQYYKDKLGKELYDKVKETMNSVARNISHSDYKSYKDTNKYLQEYEIAKKRYYDSKQAFIDAINKYAQEKGIEYYKAEREFEDTGIAYKYRDAIFKANENMDNKRKIFKNDWFDRTINDALKNVPKEKRDYLFEYLKFGGWNGRFII